MPTLDWVNKSQALEATRAVPIHLLMQEAVHRDPDARTTKVCTMTACDRVSGAKCA